MTREEQIELLQREHEAPEWIWVERPTLLHDRATGPGVCPCGCGSQSGENPDMFAAVLVETIPGPVLVLDRRTGARKYRDRWGDGRPRTPDEIADFDAMRPQCEEVYLPRRCYGKQLRALKARPKVKGVFGGVRGGKTETLSEELVDVWIERGGRGVHMWWVAPELADTLRAVQKLVTGQAIRGGANPEVRPAKLPSVLVMSSPEGDAERQLEQIKRRKPIVLIDGTIIDLRYAKRGDGGPLKGDNPIWIGVDEGGEIDSSNAWNVMIQRVTDAGGWITTATTPVIGSPLKELVYDNGTDIEEAAANGSAYGLTGWAHLSMRDNPWIRGKDVEEQIATLRKQADWTWRVAQDIDGQWVVHGQRMWAHFDEQIHAVEGSSRDVSAYSIDGRMLVDITERAAPTFWHRSDADFRKGVAGQDFNARNNYTEVAKIAHPAGTDPNDPSNWVVLFLDEIATPGDAWDAARRLAQSAGDDLGLDGDHFAKLAISCDPAGAHDQVPDGDNDNVVLAFGPARAFETQGFDCRPCHRSRSGRPKHPAKYDQCTVMHSLMRDRAKDSEHADQYPGGVAVHGAPPRTRFIVHKHRCSELLRALRQQVSTPQGIPFKRSNTASDVLSDPMDAALYLVWPLFNAHELAFTAPKINWQ